MGSVVWIDCPRRHALAILQKLAVTIGRTAGCRGRHAAGRSASNPPRRIGSAAVGLAASSQRCDRARRGNVSE